MRRTIGSAALVSALFLWPALAAAQDNPFSSCRPDDPVTFLGNRPEPIPERPGASRITLTGPVSIVCNDTRLFADEVVYEDDTGMIYATGNVALQQPDLIMFAERAVINGRTKLGTFYNANGTASIGAAPTQRSMFGTQEPDVLFHGDEISRTGETTYTIRNGAFTTCVQPTGRWEMSGSSGSINLDRYVLMRNVVLRVKNVPLLYLPAIYYPINDEDRSTGFLLPTYGTSTLHGGSISNAFFWAINRSQDATFFHDWYTKTGNGFGAEYRLVTNPASNARLNFHMLTQKALDSTGSADPLAPTRRSYRVDGDMNQTLPGNFRLMASANYFTDITMQQQHQNVYDYSQRERSFRSTLNGSIGRLRLTAVAEQRDMFYGTQSGQRIGRAPSLTVSLGDKPIGRSRVYYGASGEAAYLMRQNKIGDPTTDTSLWRFDGGPSIRAPLSSLPWLTATGSLSWRVTRWLETRDATTGQNVAVPLTRQLFDMRAQIVGPVLARVFQTPNNGYATGFKHLIEPSFTISRTAPFFDQASSDRIVKNDYAVDQLVGGVTRVDYRLTNRLLAKRPQPGAAPGTPGAQGIAREILSVDLVQSYYTDARAQAADSQYQYGNTIEATTGGVFSPIQLNATARPTDTASGRFQMEIDSKYKELRSMNGSGSIQTENLQFSTGWTKRFIIAERPEFSAASAMHYLNASAGLRTRDNRVGGTYTFDFNMKEKSFQQQRIVAYYNSQCCGVSFDWQSISTPLLGIPSDRRFGVSFTLAGIGSFSNPLGSFGGR